MPPVFRQSLGACGGGRGWAPFVRRFSRVGDRK